MIRPRLTVAILVIGLGLIWGCGSQEAKEMRIGVNAELTGSKPTVGDSCKKAAELLVAQVNRPAVSRWETRSIPIKLVCRG